MSYYLKKNVLFVRTPKTASTYCLDIIRDLGLLDHEFGHNHHKKDELKDSQEWKNARFKFCFVRDAETWYRSYFCWRRKTGWVKKINTDINLLDRDCASDDFDNFIQNIYREYPDGFHWKLMEKYKAGCDFVGRYENLEVDIQKALDLAGYGVKVDFSKYQKKKVSEIFKISQATLDLIRSKEER